MEGQNSNNRNVQETQHASECAASRDVIETRVGAGIYCPTNRVSSEVFSPPFSPEEDYIHEDDMLADIDMDLDATEQPSEEEEARDEVVHVNVDNSTPEEDHNEEEDSDMDEDMELDVDEMSYERIGNVSNGLREEDIFWHMKWYRHITFLTSSPEEEDLCGICLDEYIEGQNIGELDCEHKFHHDCIRKWLMQKNICPMCKRTGLAI
ncbi:unnamed protein product [Fraxinus pennsylvanica]|uniref:RING-type E3 ubiquitin transferase n=1 Tax=Fraxinus pennsylvanica TaxID=56036 RepID=A0AAD1YZZ5_9LAMI|nr:unnamed protein product [Fraxinus pennsylvanica]